ncbi:MAG: gamma-butyrobetaine hydroxylase-like domain-containing protein, partial [Burkholderiaceae bacterium]
MTVQGIPSFRHNDAAPVPSSVVVHQASGALELVYPDGRAFRLPFEFLRVHSPSAEVLGHGPGQEVLQVGKKHVGIASLEPVGQYAVQPRFSDGHDTGLYSWSYLYWLAENQEVLLNHYL